MTHEQNDGDCALRLGSIYCFVRAFSVCCALDPGGTVAATKMSFAIRYRPKGALRILGLIRHHRSVRISFR